MNYGVMRMMQWWMVLGVISAFAGQRAPALTPSSEKLTPSSEFVGEAGQKKLNAMFEHYQKSFALADLKLSSRERSMSRLGLLSVKPKGTSEELRIAREKEQFLEVLDMNRFPSVRALRAALESSRESEDPLFSRVLPASLAGAEAMAYLDLQNFSWQLSVIRRRAEKYKWAHRQEDFSLAVYLLHPDAQKEWMSSLNENLRVLDLPTIQIDEAALIFIKSVNSNEGQLSWPQFTGPLLSSEDGLEVRTSTHRYCMPCLSVDGTELLGRGILKL